MKFCLINCVILLVFIAQNVFTLPTFDDSGDELIQFDARMKRDVDYLDISSEENDSSPSSPTSEKPEESTLPKESRYESEKRKLQALQDRIKAAQEMLAQKKKNSATGKTGSDVFEFTPPGFTTTEAPSYQSLYEKHQAAMEKLKQGLKDALKKFEEDRKKEKENPTGNLNSTANVQKRSVNLYELRNELEERMTEIRAKRAAHRQKRGSVRALKKSNLKSDQDLLQLLNDIQEMSAKVRSVRSKIMENRK